MAIFPAKMGHSLSLLTLLTTTESEHQGNSWRRQEATIASACRHNLDHPNNTTEFVFEARLYKVPLHYILPETRRASRLWRMSGRRSLYTIYSVVN